MEFSSSIILTLILSIIVVSLSLAGMARINPVQRPFMCNDPTLSHPRKRSTISNINLYIWTLFAPLIIIFVCELFLNRRKMRSMRERLAISCRNLSFLYRHYITAFTMQNIFMTVAKLSTGSHRPDFFETCLPDKLINCTANTFVFNYKCTNTEVRGFYLRDSGMSFFSGHAMFLAYSCCFLTFYLHYRLRSEKKLATFALPLIQSVLISFAFFGCISRVFDNRHHVVDISAGAIVGVLVSVHVWLLRCKNLKFNNVHDDEKQYNVDEGNDEIMPVNRSNNDSS